MSTEAKASDDSYIDDVFGEGGYLSKAIPGYIPRPGQIALARAVHVAIAERGHLLAEGPTGTGKSLAYAVPASWWAANHDRPAVIVTANIALQEQIVNKDLPLLRSVAPWSFSFSLLKGRNNFLCAEKFYTHQAALATGRQGSLFGGIDAQGDGKKHLEIVREWASDSLHDPSATGDVSELPFEPDPAVWRQFSVTSDECKGSRCKRAKECFANTANETARRANVVVTNYHMLFAHLSVYNETGADLVISPFQACILDEAHAAADIARDFFGVRVTQESCKRVGRSIRDFDQVLAGQIEGTSALYFGQMHALKRDPGRYKARLTGHFEQKEIETADRLLEQFESVRVLLERRLLDKHALRDVEQDEKTRDNLDDEITEIEMIQSRRLRVSEAISTAMDSPSRDKSRVYFLEEDEHQRISLVSKLIHPSEMLTPSLFQKRTGKMQKDGSVIEGPPVAIAATSATLATDGNSFDYAAEELGAPTGYRSIVADSPFDYEQQCLFIAPRDMPDPNAADFRDAVANVTERVIALAGGRTLGLFTSRKSMHHTYDKVIGYCRKNGITLLKQGDGPRSKLIERFKSDTSSVLLGVDSFWAGVDVPGESLSVVLIDRLPFPTPDDPILDRLQAEDDKAFFTHSVPRAIIKFKQGAGRLIRSVKDKGVIVCCDNRLETKRYGKQFLRALPNMPKTRSLEEIPVWLNIPLPKIEPVDPFALDDDPLPAFDDVNDEEIPF